MEDLNSLDLNNESRPAPVRYEPRVRAVLLTQLGLFILGAGLGGIIFQMLCLVTGWDPNLVLGADAPVADRWQVRIQLGAGHFSAFLLSGALTVWLFYRSITGVRPDWQDYVGVRKAPGWSISGLSLLLMLVSVPLVLYSLQINQMIPMPDSFKWMEEQTEQTLKGLLHMEHWGELAANLTLIALLPAIGEELVFRVVVQKQLMRRISNPWVAIFVASVIFSMAHMQMEGFIPRLILGLLLGWLYWQTKNFWVPALAHFFNNGIQVLGQYLYANNMSTVDLEKDIQAPWEFALMSVGMVIMVMRLISQVERGDDLNTK